MNNIYCFGCVHAPKSRHICRCTAAASPDCCVVIQSVWGKFLKKENFITTHIWCIMRLIGFLAVGATPKHNSIALDWIELRETIVRNGMDWNGWMITVLHDVIMNGEYSQRNIFNWILLFYIWWISWNFSWLLKCVEKIIWIGHQFVHFDDWRNKYVHQHV